MNINLIGFSVVVKLGDCGGPSGADGGGGGGGGV